MELNVDERSQAVCRHCGRFKYFHPQYGLVHSEGLGMYWQKCLKCKWEGSRAGSYQACPECGEIKDLVDDHVVQ